MLAYAETKGRWHRRTLATADHVATLRAILINDVLRWRALGLVHSLELPDCWIAAGFIRNAVWDHLHDRPAVAPRGDIDVVWFDRTRVEPTFDKQLQAMLRTLEPSLDWSVKNQARMHTRNGDPPYSSVADAMRCWPETATSIAARRTATGQCEIVAPWGLDDLFALILRPTKRFADAKLEVYLDRIQTKEWLTAWPRLRMADLGNEGS